MMKKSARSQVHTVLLCLIDEAYDKQAWHGPNLKGSIRRGSVDEAVWRPGRG